mmetsp:Transcript_30601/g.63914  ORF Transcript_30601/g.63914 Transcript_30601/m.63914 type:complete len:120 (+) Transcript_30601:876-1235(+)
MIPTKKETVILPLVDAVPLVAKNLFAFSARRGSPAGGNVRGSSGMGASVEMGWSLGGFEAGDSRNPSGGLTEGLFVGDGVGWNVGIPVGLMDGENEGKREGCAIGDMDGLVLGGSVQST